MSFFQKEERQKWLLFIAWCDSLISQSKRRIEQKNIRSKSTEIYSFYFQLQNQRWNLIDYPQCKNFIKKLYCFYPPEDSVKWFMKNWDRKIDPDEPWKLQIFLVWGIGTPPLTARKRTAVGILPTAKNSRTVKFSSVGHSSVAALLRAIKGKPEALLPVAVFLPQLRI